MSIQRDYNSLNSFYESQKKLLKVIFGPFITFIILLIITLLISLLYSGFSGKSWSDIINNNTEEPLMRTVFMVSMIVMSIAGAVYWILNIVYSIMSVFKSVFVRGAGFYKIFYIVFCVLNIFFPTFIFVLINIILCKINLRKFE